MLGATPTVSLRVSEEFRRLYAAHRSGSDATALDRSVTCGAPIATSILDDDPAQENPVAWQAIRLRRDGQRPFRCEALPLMRLGGDDAVGGHHSLAFFLGRHLRVIGSFAFLPPPNMTAWEVHTVVELHADTATRPSPTMLHDPARGFPSAASAHVVSVAQQFFQATLRRLVPMTP